MSDRDRVLNPWEDFGGSDEDSHLCSQTRIRTERRDEAPPTSLVQHVVGGHVWRRASPMSAVCALCDLPYQRCASPTAERCPAVRVDER